MPGLPSPKASHVPRLSREITDASVNGVSGSALWVDSPEGKIIDGVNGVNGAALWAQSPEFKIMDVLHQHHNRLCQEVTKCLASIERSGPVFTAADESSESEANVDAYGYENLEQKLAACPAPDEEAVNKPEMQRCSTKASLTSQKARDFIAAWSNEKEAHMQKSLNLIAKQSRLDLIAGIAILLNTFIMMLQLESLGSQAAETFGLAASPISMLPEIFFVILEQLFTAFFLCEFFIRVRQEGMSYFKSVFNMFDFFLVMLTTVDNWILQPAMGDAMNMAQFRMLRVVKVVRVARIIRAVRLFVGLRQLIMACTSAFTALFWAVVFFVVCIIAASLLFGNLLQDFIADETADSDHRKWVWLHYGTSLRAMCTLFEMTFAGNWNIYTRPVMEYAGDWYMICFSAYVIIVVFAATRVIGAVFLKDALDGANGDAEMLVHTKEKQRLKYLEKVKDFFKAIDESGDGTISRAELEGASLQRPSSFHWHAATG